MTSMRACLSLLFFAVSCRTGHMTNDTEWLLTEARTNDSGIYYRPPPDERVAKDIWLLRRRQGTSDPPIPKIWHMQVARYGAGELHTAPLDTTTYWALWEQLIQFTMPMERKAHSRGEPPGRLRLTIGGRAKEFYVSPHESAAIEKALSDAVPAVSWRREN